MRLLKIRRVSRDHDASTALAKQDQRIDSYAEAMDHEIIGDAADADVSGKTDPFQRPGLGPWLTDPKLMSQYDGIIASHLDRLGRSTRYVGKLLEWAEDHGKVIICLDPQVDFSTPTGKLLAYIISWLAEQELALITSRSRATRQYLTGNGYLVGSPPFGFQVVPLDDHTTLAPDPDLTPKIRAAVDTYLDGANIRTVARSLGISPATLQGLLHNTSLIGRRKDANGRTVLRHEPILDRTTWNRLQAELARRARRAGVVSRETHWLTNVAACWFCGGVMYRLKHHSGEYFRCHGKEHAPSTCKNMVRIENLEQAVDDYMAGWFGRNNFVWEDIVLAGDGDHSEEIAEIEHELRDLDFDASDFAVRQEQLLAERKRLRELPAVPDIVESYPTDETVAEHWAAMTDSAERRAYLLDLGMVVRACKADVEVGFKETPRFRIEGQPALRTDGSTQSSFSVREVAAGIARRDSK